MQNTALNPALEEDFVRKKWTVKECRALVEQGLIAPGKFGLIEGGIVPKTGRSRLHILVLHKMLFLLAGIFGPDAIQAQAQIGIGERDADNDPEPDVAVLVGTLSDYIEREPDPATEVRLLIEVSDTTLCGDTVRKAALYARHGLPDYWVVSLANRVLIVHRQPSETGYAEVQTYSETALAAPLAAPNALIRVADLLP